MNAKFIVAIVYNSLYKNIKKPQQKSSLKRLENELTGGTTCYTSAACCPDPHLKMDKAKEKKETGKENKKKRKRKGKKNTLPATSLATVVGW
jgi:hypothetical protein